MAASVIVIVIATAILVAVVIAIIGTAPVSVTSAVPTVSTVITATASTPIGTGTTKRAAIASTAIAALERSWATSSAARARIRGFGFLDDDFLAFHLDTIHAFDGGAAGFFRGHFHEAVALGHARVMIHDHLGGYDFAVGFENSFQPVGINLRR